MPFLQPTAYSLQFRRRSRPGVILVLALVIALVLLVLIFSFHSTTMQGKLEVSRAFLGDAAMFLADSAAQEALAKIEGLANRYDSPWYKRFESASPADNDAFEEIGPLTTGNDSELARDLGATLSAKVRVIVLMQSQVEPREKAGLIEIEGKAVVPLGRKTVVTRRVIVRKDFKSAYLAGSSALSGYTLFVKDIRGFNKTEPAQALADEPLLIVKNRRVPGVLEADAGQVFLGTGAGTASTTPIQLLPPGRKGLIPDEIKFLQSAKVPISAGNPQTFFLGTWDPAKQTFADDAVGVEKSKSIIADMMRQLRLTNGQPFTQQMIDNVTTKVIGCKMKNEYLGADPRAAGLDIYINDPGYAVEGNVFYPYWFRREFDFEFSGATPPSKPATSAVVTISAASFLNKDPASSSIAVAPISPRPRDAPSMTVEERAAIVTRIVSFIQPKFITRLFNPTGRQPIPEAAFRERYLYVPASGPSILRLDGIVGIMGDLTLDGDTVFRGQGAILTLGKLTVKGSLTKSRTSDLCFLVARGASVTLPGGKPIEAAVHGLNMAYPDQACSFDLAGDPKPLDLTGSLAVDKLNSDRFKVTQNTIQYDENLSQYVFHTSFSDRAFLWVARGDDEKPQKEPNDG